jgi:pyruvate dehydrogenase E2 component (dihydrolipoamide acetyltransferase)
MGEGLREVLIVHFLKQPGDRILRDEPIYEMETDKAVMEVESPFDGVLEAWLASEGDVVEVNAPIARIQTDASLPIAQAIAGAPSSAAVENAPATKVIIPPRTRSYCKSLGISEADMRLIPATGPKLMPEDVDRYLASPRGPLQPSDTPLVKPGLTELPLSPAQRIFVYRLRRSAQLVIPASMTRRVDWGAIVNRLQSFRQRHPDIPVTAVTAFAYAVAMAATEHPKFRSVLFNDDVIHQYEHLNLGVAVQRPDDELVTAVIPNADALEFPQFARTCQRQITRAIRGEDQASDNVQLLLSYMADHEITHATPILVSPAIAVLFVGAPYEQGDRTLANLVLTFDHRLINGVGAAKFLHSLALQLGSGPSSGTAVGDGV